MMRRLSASILVLVAAALATSVFAASQQPLSLQQMVQFSDEIVVGRVLSSEARWQGKLIVTVTQIEVSEAIKGDHTTRLELMQLGGTALHPRTGLAVTMSASTQVGLAPGEELLLFVSRGTDDVRQIVGAQQGRMVIRQNAASGTREIPIGPKRLEVLRGTDHDTVRSTVWTLDEMRTRIREQLAPRAGREGRARP